MIFFFLISRNIIMISSLERDCMIIIVNKDLQFWKTIPACAFNHMTIEWIMYYLLVTK
jgi:hypothetical protein